MGQVLASGSSSDCCDWLECTVAGTAGVLWRCPIFICVVAEKGDVDVRLESGIYLKYYLIISIGSLRGVMLFPHVETPDTLRIDFAAEYDEEFVT